jgi:hypothetical protein
MNKYWALQKKMMVNAGVSAASLAVFGGIYFAVEGYASSKLEATAAAESALNADKAKITGFETQIRNSGAAEERFLEIKRSRVNQNFTADTEATTNWLRAAKQQYRFSSGFKLTVPPEEPTKEADLKSMNYAITLRPETKMDFEAISDVHVFSFLDNFIQQTPGIIRIDKLEVKRKADLDATSISQMQGGFAPYLASATVEFTWISIGSKDSKAAASGATGGAR